MSYKFCVYDPFRTYFKAEQPVFMNTKGNPIPDDTSPDLFLLGKKAFDYLEPGESKELMRLIEEHFSFIRFLCHVTNTAHDSGRLKFQTILGKEAYAPYAILHPDEANAEELIDATSTVLEFFNELCLTFSEHETDESHEHMESDVAITCLLHTLIQVDRALLSQRIDPLEAVAATQSAMQSLTWAENYFRMLQININKRTTQARNAANKSHQRTNEAKEKIRSIWASGKYSSRSICAEQECGALGISYDTARKALINTPNPTKP